MATFHQALPRIADGRFDYTSRSDEQRDSTRAEGYCAGWRDFTPEEEERLTKLHGEHFLKLLKQDQEKKVAFKSKYHTDGHATAEEAEACWREYEIDNYFEVTTEEDSKKACVDCGDWTHGRIGLRGPHSFGEQYPACEKHQSRNVLKKALDAARDRRRAERHAT